MSDSTPPASTVSTPPSRSAKWKIVGLVVAVVGLGPAFRFLPIAQGLADFLEYVRGVGVWGPALLAAVYGVATVLMAPGLILTLGAGYAFGVVWGTVAVSEGSVVGATLAFLVGRYAARDFVGALAERHPRFGAIDRGGRPLGLEDRAADAARFAGAGGGDPGRVGGRGR